MLGSVLKHGLCAAYLQGKPARYTSLLTRGKTKDLSHGHSGKDFPQHTGPCQPDKSLAHLPDFAQTLIKKARLLYADDSFGVELEQTIYALDATTIDLCLSLFPWAAFRKRKGAVKLHTLLDLRGNIPTLAFITSGKVHEVNILDKLSIDAGAIYIMDRGYLDYARLYNIDQSAAYFVTRAKSNFSFQQLYLACSDDHRALSQTLADRVILQMDQVASANKSILWNVRKCGQDANMDCHHHLCAGSYHQKAIEVETESLHNFTDCKRNVVREIGAIAGAYRHRSRKARGANL